MTALPDLFPGFARHKIDVGDVTLHARIGGSGPALLCLHGYPQTHVCWHAMAPTLSQHFTVVAMDLRGYGESSAPQGDPAHETYSKRTMARDAVALMAKLGHNTFSIMGHDRGARVAYRLALDTPDVVERLIILDIITTIDAWERTNARSALKSYHWPFLAQPHPMPETLIGGNPDAYADHTLASWTKDKSLDAFSPDALAHYRANMRDTSRIHAMCEDYRAGATYDWTADEQSRRDAIKITAPTLLLWSAHYLTATKNAADPLAAWRPWAPDVVGAEIDCGHFLAEENPQDTLASVLPFMGCAPH